MKLRGLGLRLFLAASLCLPAAWSCSGDVAEQKAPPADGGTPTPTTCGGLVAPSDACAACESAACCEPAAACAATPSCAAFEVCLSACAGDTTCRAACVQSNGGVPLGWAALETCQASACADACGASCGKALPVHDTLCTGCATVPCCQQLAACATDLDCSKLVSCIESCGTDDDCAALCVVTNQAGKAKLNAVSACVSGGECAAACSGADLSCVGAVQWPQASGAKYGYQMVLHDAQSGKPMVGAQLLACTRSAVECTPESALGGAISDANGAAGVLVDGAEIAWLRVDGPGDFLPALLFFRPHLVETTFLDVFFYSLSAASQQMSSAAKIDPTTAQLHVVVTDCKHRPLVGAQVDVEVLGFERTVFYTRADSTPDPKLIATGPTGEVRVLNIPVTEADGFPLADITVRSTTGAKVAHTSVRLRAGYWSELWGLGPTPTSE
ncbi:MAG: hypothetical protein IPI67_05950 [Myxococcales bacterium]|nr:hypothetical protein [Myxococcales bacterium]